MASFAGQGGSEKRLKASSNNWDPLSSDRLFLPLPRAVNVEIFSYFSVSDMICLHSVSKCSEIYAKMDSFWKRQCEVLLEGKQNASFSRLQRDQDISSKSWHDTFKDAYLDGKRGSITSEELTGHIWCFSTLNQELMFNDDHKLNMPGHDQYSWGFTSTQKRFFDERLVIPVMLTEENVAGEEIEVDNQLVENSNSSIYQCKASGVVPAVFNAGDRLMLPVNVCGDIESLVRAQSGDLVYISNFPAHRCVRLPNWGWVIYNDIGVFFYTVEKSKVQYNGSLADLVGRRRRPVICPENMYFALESLCAFLELAHNTEVLNRHPILRNAVRQILGNRYYKNLRFIFQKIGAGTMPFVELGIGETKVLWDMGKTELIRHAEYIRRTVEPKLNPANAF
jgi:hypothetical protein